MHDKTMEELSLNNWQPLSTLLYDGWVLRFANGYTKRANSIQPIFYSTYELEQKIDACEKIYSEKIYVPYLKLRLLFSQKTWMIY